MVVPCLCHLTIAGVTLTLFDVTGPKQPLTGSNQQANNYQTGQGSSTAAAMVAGEGTTGKAQAGQSAKTQPAAAARAAAGRGTISA